MNKEYNVYSSVSFRILVYVLETNGYILKVVTPFKYIYSNRVNEVIIKVQF